MSTVVLTETTDFKSLLNGSVVSGSFLPYNFNFKNDDTGTGSYGTKTYRAANGIVTFDSSGLSLSPDTSTVFNGTNDTGLEVVDSASEPWVPQNSPSTLRYGSNIVITSSRVYVIGGRDSSNIPVSMTEYAPLDADGSISGPWQPGSTLPVGVAWAACAYTSDRVYIIGGYTGGGADVWTDDVYSAPIDGSGVIGTWVQESNLYPRGVRASEALATSSRVYVFGGETGVSSYTGEVYYAPINGDGSLGTWVQDANLPRRLAYFGLASTDSRVYIIGGNSGAILSPYVYSAPIDGSGIIGAWTEDVPTPITAWEHSAVCTGSYVYSLGRKGHPSGADAVVQRGTLDVDGRVDSWEIDYSATLPEGMRHTCAGVADDYVIIPGGMDSSNLPMGTYQAEVRESGELGPQERLVGFNGDFDIQVDFSLSNWAPTVSTEASVLFGATDVTDRQIAVERRYDGITDQINTYTSLGSGIAASRTDVQTGTTLTSGQLRITRVGELFDTYWRASSGDSWTTISSSLDPSGDFSDVPMYVWFGCASTNISTQPNATFTNFVINSGTLIGEYPETEGDGVDVENGNKVDWSQTSHTVTGTPTVKYQYRSGDNLGTLGSYNGTWLTLGELQSVANPNDHQYAQVKMQLSGTNSTESLDEVVIYGSELPAPAILLLSELYPSGSTPSSHEVSEITSAPTITTSDLNQEYIFSSGTSGSETISLPSVGAEENLKWIIIGNESPHIIEIQAADSDAIGWSHLHVDAAEILPNTRVELQYSHTTERWRVVEKSGGQLRPAGTKVYCTMSKSGVLNTSSRPLLEEESGAGALCYLNDSDVAVTGQSSSTSTPPWPVITRLGGSSSYGIFASTTLVSSLWDPITNSTTNNVTITGWVKFDNSASGSEDIFMIYQDVNDHFYIRRDSSGYLHLLSQEVSNTILEMTSANVGMTLGAGHWYHIAFVRKGTECGLYVNGTQVSYDQFSNTATFATNAFRLGDNGAGGGRLDGELSDIAIAYSNIFGANPQSDYSDSFQIYSDIPLGLIL